MSEAQGTGAWLLRRLLGAAPLLLGVTLFSFTLTVHFGPEQTWELLGRNPSPEQVEQVRRQLGYDRPFVERYLHYLADLARFDLGRSQANGEPVAELLERTVPVSLALLLPGFVLGIGIALVLALRAAWRPGGFVDRFCDITSALGMSLSLVITVIAAQLIFGVWLGWFPVRGWQMNSLATYLHHLTVPTLAIVVANFGYNLRFFRAVFRERLADHPVRTARAYGLGPGRILSNYVLRASALPILTRVVFAVPLILISGSLIIESHFGIPGVGRITYQAILSGDQPVLMAVVSFSAVLFVLALTAADLLGRLADPRVDRP